ncbi:MAG: thioredoxin family protein [Nevskia sp.]|nr:thioredoxin family protein [Nevskia sp.]
MNRRVLAVLLIGGWLAACSESRAPVAPAAVAAQAKTAVAAPAEHAKPDGIAWRDGQVTEALAEAAETGKPVLLYWEAVWCPPCNQLKATLFKQPEFIARTRAFLPVYLDGDSSGAQKWAEHFAIVGYPTMIVLRADGTELTRLDGGLDPGQYPKLLDAASRQTQPIGALLDQATAEPQALSADDWTLLASYGWYLDDVRLANMKALAAKLDQLASLALQPDLKQRFSVLAWAFRLDNAKKPEQAIPVAEQAACRKLLQQILAEPASVRANLLELEYRGADLLRSVAKPGSTEWRQRATSLQRAMDAVQADPDIAVLNRLYSRKVAIDLARYEAGKRKKLPAALTASLLAQVKAADAETRSPHERMAVINTAADLLQSAGLGAEAEALLKAEVERSDVPYYFMGWLAGLAQERGDKTAAKDWARQAWERSEGPATRVQWGTDYITMLIALVPADAATIEQIVASIIDEAVAVPDAYYGRTRRSFARLDKTLRAWATAHKQDAVLQRLHARVQPLCAALPANAEPATACGQFLSI